MTTLFLSRSQLTLKKWKQTQTFFPTAFFVLPNWVFRLGFRYNFKKFHSFWIKKMLIEDLFFFCSRNFLVHWLIWCCKKIVLVLKTIDLAAVFYSKSNFLHEFHLVYCKCWCCCRFISSSAEPLSQWNRKLIRFLPSCSTFMSGSQCYGRHR